jgi:site-specific recombinase XerD
LAKKSGNRKQTISELIRSFELSNRAASKSPRTVKWYDELLNCYVVFLETEHQRHDLTMFTKEMAREYIIYLQHKKKYSGHPYTPTQSEVLSPKTVQAHARALKAFSTWLYDEGYTEGNRLQALRLPKAPIKRIQPLSPQEIQTITAAIDKSSPKGQRDYLIVAMMLDSGLRLSGSCGITLDDVNLSQGSIRVVEKGAKERAVPIGRFVTGLLIHYIDEVRPKLNSKGSEYLFLSKDGNQMTANAIKLMFSRLAKKSGIIRLHAHLCRHTFAINYLLNGGDIFSLKEILGHSTLEMVNHYLHFTQAQISNQHRKYSPMDRFYLAQGEPDQ